MSQEYLSPRFLIEGLCFRTNLFINGKRNIILFPCRSSIPFVLNVNFLLNKEYVKGYKGPNGLSLNCQKIDIHWKMNWKHQQTTVLQLLSKLCT